MKWNFLIQSLVLLVSKESSKILSCGPPVFVLGELIAILMECCNLKTLGLQTRCHLQIVSLQKQLNWSPCLQYRSIKSIPPPAVRGLLTTLFNVFQDVFIDYRISSCTWSGHARFSMTWAYHVPRLSSHNGSLPVTFHVPILVFPCIHQAVSFSGGTASCVHLPTLLCP